MLTRWHVAGLVWRWLPDVRGRDRLASLVAGPQLPQVFTAAPVEVSFGPGLRARVRLDQDGSFAEFFYAQYRNPTLIPILEAVLSPGAVFYDVGANVGIYSLWASRLIGDAGQVVAFEPVPATASWLADVVGQNALANIEVVRAAASSQAGDVEIEVIPGASGLSHVTGSGRPRSTHPHATVTTPAITLDDMARVRRPPNLVKIDVEGHEPEVVAGMEELLGTTRPVVVFEAPDLVGVAGGSAKLVSTFAIHGYRVWSLTSKGLAAFAPDDFSHNLLALHETDHSEVHRTVLHTPFNRNQNC